MTTKPTIEFDQWIASRQGPQQIQAGASSIYGYQYPEGIVIEIMSDGGYLYDDDDLEVVRYSLERMERWLWFNLLCNN